MAVVQELSPAPDPARCCEQLASLPYRLFLDSAARGGRLGRYSFLSADPIAIVRSKGAQTQHIDRVTGAVTDAKTDALTLIRSLLEPHRASHVDALPPFQGGAAGYIAYDWGLTLERLPAPRYDDLAMDDVVLGLYDWVIAWDHGSNRAWLIVTDMRPGDPAERAREILRNLETANHEPRTVNWNTNRNTNPEPGTRNPERPPRYRLEPEWWSSSLELSSSFTREAYEAAVQRVIDYIYAGDIFQANFSQRFEAPFTGDVWALYQRLRTRNAAPFAAFLDVPGAAILSASPERFLRVDATGHVETRPIKGTRPRGLSPLHDAALGQALTESPKDRAENLMIVDLLRNDLSRVCLPGSVRVPELFTLERYATVHHLVSTVVGQLAPGTDALDLLRAAFPGGSITGAPKVRAMEIIAELEPSQRGVYCGSIGYWSVSGELDTSIAIRTAVVRDGRVYFSAGGGIVADSVPALEYRETLDKARGLIDALVESR